MVVLVIATWTDYKKKEIPDWLTYGAFILTLAYRLWKGDAGSYLLEAAFVFVAIMVVAVLSKSFIGGGDIKLLTFLGLATGFPIINGIIMIAFVSALLYAVATRKKGVIFAPFITVAFLITLFLQQFNTIHITIPS